MAQIKSSPVAAQAAIQELVGVDTTGKQNQQVEFSYSSDIAGMENARQTTNTMLEAVASFSQATLTQASKFPEIAQVMAKRDVEESKRWEK